MTQATWTLEPVPPLRAGVRAALRQVERLGEVVAALLPLDPSAVEFLDATFLGFVGRVLDQTPGGPALREAGALLMVEFEGEVQDDLDQRVLRAAELLQGESLDVQVARGGRGLDALWEIRHAASPLLARLGDQKRSLQVIEDACVPVERLGDYITGVRAAAARQGLDVVLFGHAGDGNVHANLLPDVTRPDWVVGVKALFEEVTGLVLALGGAPSGEHGDGRLRASVLERLYGLEIVELFRRVKRAFDPRGILNPGVKLANGESPLARLKVGSDATRLPDDIAAALRALERNADYGVARLDLADNLDAGG